MLDCRGDARVTLNPISAVILLVSIVILSLAWPTTVTNAESLTNRLRGMARQHPIVALHTAFCGRPTAE
ncbi:hypothetical protein EGR_10230 [Echinococcus granulosus]|uniref:Uncharacterized protein n=1 Tax=Echinococcus granulosus TaxID=6210 RepID=W6U1D4_ECHGR|nr:hypothetical protein EGR_10230 [Echinococcus granulosus]EUB54920.1 hypothetical protein EGR_10230 [Echinococcus granulosus]